MAENFLRKAYEIWKVPFYNMETMITNENEMILNQNVLIK